MDEFFGHELRDWLPQEPWQGPPLPEFLNIYWPWYSPAAFEVTDLVISPTEVNLGQVVTINALVTNIGDETGDYTVKMGGDFVAETVVTLAPGESKTISFEVVPTVAKVYGVSVNGLSGSFKATEAPVADIRVHDLRIQPSEVIVGGSVLIAVTATNYGNASGSKKIVCTVS